MGRKSNVEIVNQFRKNLLKKINIEKIILFGSRAEERKKYSRWSDFDIIIVSKDFEGVNFFERAADLYKYWSVDYPIDFICLTPGEFNKLKKGITVVSEALKKGIDIR